jgi:hypothetical protein
MNTEAMWRYISTIRYVTAVRLHAPVTLPLGEEPPIAIACRVDHSRSGRVTKRINSTYFPLPELELRASDLSPSHYHGWVVPAPELCCIIINSFLCYTLGWPVKILCRKCMFFKYNVETHVWFRSYIRTKAITCKRMVDFVTDEDLLPISYRTPGSNSGTFYHSMAVWKAIRRQ